MTASGEVSSTEFNGIDGLASWVTPSTESNFYRIDTARAQSREESSEATSGSGLGLAIVQAIAQAFGGEVEVRNQADGGATFTVWLPGA